MVIEPDAALEPVGILERNGGSGFSAGLSSCSNSACRLAPNGA